MKKELLIMSICLLVFAGAYPCLAADETQPVKKKKSAAKAEQALVDVKVMEPEPVENTGYQLGIVKPVKTVSVHAPALDRGRSPEARQAMVQFSECRGIKSGFLSREEYRQCFPEVGGDDVVATIDKNNDDQISIYEHSSHTRDSRRLSGL